MTGGGLKCRQAPATTLTCQILVSQGRWRLEWTGDLLFLRRQTRTSPSRPRRSRCYHSDANLLVFTAQAAAAAPLGVGVGGSGRRAFFGIGGRFFNKQKIGGTVRIIFVLGPNARVGWDRTHWP